MSDTTEQKPSRPRPLPQRAQTNAPFWDAARAEKLLLQYDRATGHWQFWPRPNSVRTGRADLEWRESAGRGVLYSFTMSAIPAAGFEHRMPYAVGLIELDDGVRIIANLIDVDPADIIIGMRLRVVWESIGPDIKFPAFQPDR